MLMVHERATDGLNYFNIGPADEGISVLRIAQAVLREASPHTPLRFTGGHRGWIGDIPKFRYSIEKIRRLGWQPKLTSMQAIDRAVIEIHRQLCVQSL
jgi:UDP-glucose 4-epimerase